MTDKMFLGLDCGSVSLNSVLINEQSVVLHSAYLRTNGRPGETLISAIQDMRGRFGDSGTLSGAYVTGSGRELLSQWLNIPAINEISAHATGAFHVNPAIRTIIEIGGQDSKFIRLEPPDTGTTPRIVTFRMNEICAAGTGAFLDEQADRLGIPVESFQEIACQAAEPAAIAGRCAVFAKTDMIHQAQEGTPLPKILLGAAYALVRNYIATLIRGGAIVPLVSLQGGVMANGAVVQAFRDLLDLSEDRVIIPPYFTVLGALGCAVMAQRAAGEWTMTLEDLQEQAGSATLPPFRSAPKAPLVRNPLHSGVSNATRREEHDHEPPYVMGLDVGSVSVKGVVIDSHGRIVCQDYCLSSGKPLEALERIIGTLNRQAPAASVCAVTGSGRILAGRLIHADLTVNEITAQARAAVSHDPLVDTIVEIGGQDSKWISLQDRTMRDFEMNRVCAAGTGSFLMEQADRLDLHMGEEFSDAAFSSACPSDLGTRCTVFMESDLIHHQNNGSSRGDLAAGVAVSIVRNYLERVANHKTLGGRIMFLGGVAANDAVRAAFERETGETFQSPEFFAVSGALGAALKALDAVNTGDVIPYARAPVALHLDKMERKSFSCSGCTNQCTIDRYSIEDRVVYHGGRCDRWEVAERADRPAADLDTFGTRNRLLEALVEQAPSHEYPPTFDRSRLCDGKGPAHGSSSQTLGIIRSPHFYEWFPFWKGFWQALGVEVKVAPPPDRRQFEKGTRFLRVETCLPMKVMAGQIRALMDSGVRTIFHPAVLSEKPMAEGGRPMEHCPYIQASSQFFKGSFDAQWLEPVISYGYDPESFREEHLCVAERLGAGRNEAAQAFEHGMEAQESFQAEIRQAGRHFLDSLGDDEQALVVLGKPYHTAEPFLNMNLGSLFQRLGIKALPGDSFPLEGFPTRNPITWKHQLTMITLARAIARDHRLFPVMITFFGCGPDPFTVRHIKESLKGKPLLMLEMDEHSSRAGIMTRLEAFLDHIKSSRAGQTPGKADRIPSPRLRAALRSSAPATTESTARAGQPRGGTNHSSTQATVTVGPESSGIPKGPGRVRTRASRRVDTIYVPHFSDHTHAFAAAARSMGIDARVLPSPNEESERLGRPYLMGGECHPYALILGDYLRLAGGMAPEEAKRSIFCVPGYSACRLAQYPVYMEKIRKECGFSMRVIADLSQALTAFGLSKKHRDSVVLRTYEGLNAYDVLLQAYLKIRPVARDQAAFENLYAIARENLFHALSDDRGPEALEDALHALYEIPVEHDGSRPLVAVTGDYYTRVVSFANNEVFREVERLGGTIWSPPTFSDGLKLYYLQEILGNAVDVDSMDFHAMGDFYGSLVLSELRIKGSALARRTIGGRLDPFGLRARKAIARHMDPRFPPGMGAPLATALSQIEGGAHGVLNLITLNCSYGTVVTAALGRVLKDRVGFPFLTLVYDGLKKTNEKTRIEAFMEQVFDQFRRT